MIPTSLRYLSMLGSKPRASGDDPVGGQTGTLAPV